MPKPLPLEMFSAWLDPVQRKIPEDLTSEEAGELAEAVLREALSRLEAFMKGLRAYQSSEALPPARDDVQTVWQSGTTRLLDYAPKSQGSVVLVVPSLVNRFAILDIEEKRSFLRFVASQGFRPLVIDWDAPGEDEKGFSLSDYMTKRLLPILDVTEALAAGRGVHLLGYCMGGVLALALALRRTEAVRSLTLMATPWDFSVGGVGGVPAASTPVGRFFLDQALQWQPYLEKVGIVPPAIVQTVLTSFQPLSILQKFTKFASQPQDTEAARRFVLTEDWLNDGVALTVPVARECLQDWYENNALASLSWPLAGTKIDPRQIDMPTYIMVPQHDRIVPPASALPLASLIRGATLIQPEVGHIGLMSGEKAKALVWEPFIKWLRETDTI